MKRTLVALALAVFFVVALAAPAFAQMTHTAAYEFDGTINFEKQAGHKCNTGAEIKQTIYGSGVMDKTQSVSMNAGKISMEDDNNWVAGATPLTVTTVWELCTPPKYTYEDTVVPLHWIYRPAGEVAANLLGPVGPEALWDGLTDQIWAVQVQADPGFSGNLYQDGVAAYGSFRDRFVGYNADPNDEFNTWQFDTTSYKNNWRWETDEDGVLVAGIGANFVGDFFTMEQHARTSQGTQRRYIDLSSPWSHAYLYEDMSIVGRSDITDAVAMINLPAGADVPGDWWKLF